MRRYAERIDDPDYRAEIEKLLKIQVCQSCHGERLRPESRVVHVNKLSVIELARLPFTDLAQWLQTLPEKISAHEMHLAGVILDDLYERVRHLVDVGIGYLTMERASPSLSGGEEQRLRLAALLGSGLTGVLYILDEPTVGLHARDTAALIATLRRLRDLGNTVVVIEHDIEMISAADHVIELGPGAGEKGGCLVAVGRPEQIACHPDSIIGKYLSGKLAITRSQRKSADGGKYLVIKNAYAHNLKHVTVQLPLEKFITITSVSGSGKSSLILDILGRSVQ